MKFKSFLVVALVFSIAAIWYLKPTAPSESLAQISTPAIETAPSTTPPPSSAAQSLSPPAADQSDPTPAPAVTPDMAVPDDLIAQFEQMILAQIPASQLKSKLLTLAPNPRLRALKKLQELQIPAADFASLRVKSDGGLFYANDAPPPPLPPQEAAPAATGESLALESSPERAEISAPGSIAAAAVPVASPPIRNSRPGSTNVLYLDFNGHVITGTSWNSDPEDAHAYVGVAYDTDGDLTSFSDDEQSDIIEIWERVAEDFAPFDVNVTTVEPSTFTSTTGRALITANVDANGVSMPAHTGGGVAQLGVFGNSDYATRSSPAFVYYNNFGSNEANIAEAVSHELGHNFGLSHDGLTGTTYYNGHGSGNISWGPIMGTGYGRNVSQWSQGEYFNANNTQDDFAIMAAAMGYGFDEAGATTATATAATVAGSTITNSGIIAQQNDVDIYSFSTATSSINLAVKSYRVSTGTHGGNGDLKLELLDASGSVVATHAPSGDTNASLTYSATAGTYFVRITPDGEGSPLANPSSGYTSYGSAGHYTLTGTIIAAAPSITSASTESIGAGQFYRYTIVGTNGPTNYQATGLPTGLSVDAHTGIIGGRATVTGVFSISLSATNSLGTGNATLTLTVTDAAPAVIDQTSGRVLVAPGDSPSLSVTALSANGTPTYQWDHNGRPIAGATSATLNLTTVTRANHGYYRARITNTIGTTTSTAVFLVVAPTSSQVLIWGGNDKGQINVPSDLAAATQISLGSEFAIALLRDGTVSGWGANSSGQTTIPSGLTDVVQIATGSFHAIALKADGTVVGWGYDFHDQATVPSHLSGVVYIAAGNDSSFAVKNDGTVVGWGLNNDSQTTIPGDLTNAIAVATGDGHTVAAKADGSVVAWGRDDQGQITVASKATSSAAVSAGFSFSLAHQVDGAVVFWGQNSFGQQTLPQGLTTFAEVAAGSYHTIARNPDDTIAVWGYNGDKQLDAPANLGQAFNVDAARYNSAVIRDATGDVAPTIATHPVPQTVVEATDVTLTVVASGGTALLSYQWRKGGVNIDGATSTTFDLPNAAPPASGNYDVVVTNQFGSITSTVASLTVNPLPVISAQSSARRLTAPGQTLDLSVTATGTGALAYQWYQNGRALTGATTPAYSKTEFSFADAGVYQVTITDSIGVRRSALMFVLYSPAQSEVVGWGLNTSGQTTIPTGLGDAIAVATGSSHTLALKSDGTVTAWGSNNRGETTVPEGLTDVVKIAAGDDVSFALKSDGTLTIWGSNGFTIATHPSGLSDVVDIVCYRYHALALTADGSVVGWGNSGSGQLSIPTNLGTVTAIGTASSTSYAINTDGTIFGWGDNNNGETNVPTASPLWRSISGGGFHAVALKSNGVMAGIGFSGYSSPSPAVTDLVVVSAGGRHSIGLKSNRTIEVWGGNDDGESTVPTGLDNVFGIAAGPSYSLAIKEILQPTAPAITSQPSDQTVTLGESASFSVTASGFPDPTYQWRKGSVNITGATSATFTIGTTTTNDTGSYDVVVTNPSGKATSPAATLTVQTLPAISGQPQTQTVTVGTEVTLSVNASGVPAPTFQWRKDSSPISGATGSSLALGAVALTDTGSYDVVVTNVVGNVTSTVAVVTVQAGPAITTHPQSQSAILGTDVTFNVTAAGTPAPTYQWRKDGSPINGATSSSFQLTGITIDSSGSYDVVLTNSVGSLTSNGASLNVQFAPTFLVHPRSQAVNSGTNVTLNISVTGNPAPSFQWRKNGEAITSANASSLDLGAVSPGANGDYDVVVTNSIGAVTSSVATVTALFAPSINVQPSSQTVTAGDNVTFTVTAAGDPAPPYQWRKDGVDIAGANNASYTIANTSPDDAADYDVVLTNSVGTATSVLATLDVRFAPLINVQPTNQTVTTGNAVTFIVSASGDPAPNYQWRKVGEAIAGATSATYTIANTSPDDSANYDVVVTNDVGSTESDVVSLDVQFAPSILNQPQSQTVNSGASVTLAAIATGNPLPTLIWRKNSNAIAGAISSSLDLGAVSPGANGDYDVIATNAVGSITSETATLTVLFAPSINVQPTSQTVTAGDNVTFTVSTSGDPTPTYQWRRGGIDINGANSASFTISGTSTEDTSDYDVVLTNSVGTATSVLATLDVQVAPTFSIEPESQTVNSGINVTLTAAVTGNPIPTLQWRKNGEAITGAINATLDLGTVSPGANGDYDVIATNAVGSITSETATVTVLFAPSINVQPTSQTVTADADVTFTVSATGDPIPTYQWRQDGSPLPGETGASLQLNDISTSTAGAYDVVVTNDVESVTSDTATLTVNEGPTITTQPVSQTVSVGTTVILSVEATGSPAPTYQWQKDSSPIDAATNASLNLGAIPLKGDGDYTVRVTNSVGTATSATAKLTVQEAPAITTPPAPQTAYAGSPVNFSVVATGTPTPSYQWLKNGTAIDGATNSSLSLSLVSESDAGSYTVSITNELNSVLSTPATLTVVTVSGTHASDGYRLGEPVTIDNTVTYSGPLIKFVWSVIPPAEIGGQKWSLASSGGSTADASPAAGTTDLLEWTWHTVPPSPFNFAYSLVVPDATTDGQSLTAMFESTSAAGPLQSIVLPDPLVLSAVATYHTADINEDFKLGLAELLRVIELYNTRSGTTRTGRYQVQSGTEDGFAPDPTAGTTQSSFHAADFNLDSKISLSELLRVIELYNTRSGTTRTGKYHIESGTEDGFAPGPSS